MFIYREHTLDDTAQAAHNKDTLIVCLIIIVFLERSSDICVDVHPTDSRFYGSVMAFCLSLIH